MLRALGDASTAQLRLEHFASPFHFLRSLKPLSYFDTCEAPAIKGHISRETYSASKPLITLLP
jgi:hypothetical protein